MNKNETFSLNLTLVHRLIDAENSIADSYIKFYFKF